MYIDGVFSGGGIKGLALVGACAAIEERGFRFKRVAGTSAGSLIAGLLAAGYTSAEMAGILDDLDLKKFLDSRKTIIPSALTKWLFVYWRLGLYKGDELERWIGEKLAARGLRTFGDLAPDSLRIIASDLTNGRLLILPDDLPMYGVDPMTFPVAKAIRMSCSLPFFFEPVKLRDRVGSNIVVDGGVLSNFPMWLFDKDNVKKVRPVLGIKLSQNLIQQPTNKIKNALQMFEALFETMKDAHDSRYISRKHEKNIIFIPTEGNLTTEFQLSNEKKHELIDLGQKSAEKFFKSWCY
ncbi:MULTISPECIES: patatin-like phospholipase family protein [unclassified Bacillus (in: firmicutes)]|uniref:patatin-like phospholipase family protein n=1 Tax=unclassified Bacillus (in: firmicutes) TaxID=185979 RepID=UPI001BECE1CB|nr:MULTISPECIES: patatin-like phospholipase family protein [unclassified Bacillus (in: firmicutes)]MBT2636611.1 patatin-like phospholipase family protein [Bacillus sp. ISL-39]MBT2660850.1 patatin-like phospholipase family protein [Bacillus sp. ISL-45]